MFDIDIVKAIQRFELMGYLKFWNFVDWAHFSVMWTAWYFWLNQVNMSNSLDMPSGFAVLSSFNQFTLARLFLTNPQNEYQYLVFLNQIKQMADNLSTYSVLTSISGTRFS